MNDRNKQSVDSVDDLTAILIVEWALAAASIIGWGMATI
jgi:hypothetical protein